jgi:hypothetical protein
VDLYHQSESNIPKIKQDSCQPAAFTSTLDVVTATDKRCISFDRNGGSGKEVISNLFYIAVHFCLYAEKKWKEK